MIHCTKFLETHPLINTVAHFRGVEDTERIAHVTRLAQRRQGYGCAQASLSRLRHGGYPINPCHARAQEKLLCNHWFPIQKPNVVAKRQV